MRAVVATAFGGPDVLMARDLPEPEAGPGQVVIDVGVASVLFVDTQIRAGSARHWFPTEPPYVPGLGVAGTVTAVGSGVDTDWLGRRIVADTPAGGYLERTVVDADSLAAVPDAVGLADAAALLHDGKTALGLVELTKPVAGEWVLIVGAAGGLGLVAVQLARQAGARVIGTARGEPKLALVRSQGAEAVVDSTVPGWVEQVRELTGGAGADVVLDGVGGTVGRSAFEVTARGGRFSAHGAPSGGFTVVEPHEAEERGISVTGIDALQYGPSDGLRLIAATLAEAGSGRVHAVVGQTFPLEAAADAHRAIESRTVTGKTLLEVS